MDSYGPTEVEFVFKEPLNSTRYAFYHLEGREMIPIDFELVDKVKIESVGELLGISE